MKMELKEVNLKDVGRNELGDFLIRLTKIVDENNYLSMHDTKFIENLNSLLWKFEIDIEVFECRENGKSEFNFFKN